MMPSTDRNRSLAVHDSTDHLLLYWERMLREGNGPMIEHESHPQEGEWSVFLDVWNRLHVTRGSELGQALDELAYRFGMQGKIRAFLDEGTHRERLLAIAAAGYLRDVASWRKLRQFLEASEADLSLAAAEALLSIDAARAITIVVRQLGRRADWRYEETSSILRPAGKKNISTPIAITALYAQGDDVLRILPYLALIDLEIARSTIRQICDSNEDARIRIACKAVLDRLGCPPSHVPDGVP